LPVVIIRCDFRLLNGIRNAGKRKLRVPPGKFAIAKSRVQCDLASCVLGNVYSIVNSICCARRNYVNVNYCARGPRVAFVNAIAMRIHLQRAIKMRSLLYWTFPIILDHTTPENGLAFIISAPQFEPGVVSIDSPARKEVP